MSETICVGAALAACAILLLSSAPVSAAAPAPLIGPYIWGGYLPGKTLAERRAKSVRFMLDKGFKAVRIAISERDTGPSDCPGPHRLTCAVTTALRDRTFDDARLRLLMITLQDSRVRQLLNRPVETNKAALKALGEEYDEALNALAMRFRNHKVTIVISNWEGDNMVYCGAVYRFGRDPGFAHKCAPDGRADIARRLDAFFDWVRVRRDEVLAVKRRYPGLDLRYAVEFSALHLDDPHCTICDPRQLVVSRLMSEGQHDLCSYSAYQSVRRRSLPRDIEELASTCRQLILGELGIDHLRPNVAAQHWQDAAAAIMRERSRLFAVFVWHGFDSADTGKPGFGLFEGDGSPTGIKQMPASLLPGRR